MGDISKLFRIISSESARMNYTSAIATEGKTIYERVAEVVCRPGMSRKAMDNAVSRALKGYALWRTRACRLGEAGPFSAAAIRDLQVRYRQFMETDGQRILHERAVEAAKRPADEPEYVQLGRAEFEKLLLRISALEAALRS